MTARGTIPSLLVIDHDASILDLFRRRFLEPEFLLRTAATATLGLKLAAEDLPDVAVIDLQLPDLSGMEVFHRLRQFDLRIPVIFVTRQGNASTAIEAMKQGAYDYLLKPLTLDQVGEAVLGAVRVSRLMRVRAVLDQEEGPETRDDIIGRCPAMQEVYKAIGRVAPQDVSVLILGESGTGKELVARALYQHSKRADRPFLAINCAAIPETLLESELFGHEKGAFTGADRRRIGKFEKCHGGTLFLDEVGDMTPLTQTKILRVLQEQAFERVGGNETIRTDVRLIAATNRDLDDMVSSGQFRSDLYYRLSVFGIALPPLREREGDLTVLIDYFLKRFNRELGKEVTQLAPEALYLLRQHPWPGNLRELQSVLKQALLRSTGPVLLEDFLPPLSRPAQDRAAPPPDYRALERFVYERLEGGTTRLYADFQEETERFLLTRVLRHTHGNQLQAARILGVTRGKLRSRLRLLGLSTDRSHWLAQDHLASTTDSPGAS
jgi:two-component system nitrogen regulation response regulator GlnG